MDSTWIGITAYSLSVALAILWIGICMANWLDRRSWCAVLLGGSALCWAVFFMALVIISSDWWPAFSGPRVALLIRVTNLLAVIMLIMFTAGYLMHKRKGRGC